MQAIRQSSQEISKTLSTLDGIAFQTNILALNAAVEAARAGQAGTGFAVVADEVRMLAQRSAQAARDTADLVGRNNSSVLEVQGRLDTLHASMQQSADIRADVQRVADTLADHSAKQALKLEQIGAAITQIGQVSQQTAANAEESASASEQLTAQSQALKDLVECLAAVVGHQS